MSHLRLLFLLTAGEERVKRGVRAEAQEREALPVRVRRVSVRVRASM